jgi:phosphatidylserine decarboxylase
MVRIIPNRLKPGFSNSPTTNSTSNSRSTSPMGTKGGDSASPEGRKDNGLVLNVVILRVRAAACLLACFAALRCPWKHKHTGTDFLCAA